MDSWVIYTGLASFKLVVGSANACAMVGAFESPPARYKVKCVVWCGVVWCGVAWRGVVWCGGAGRDKQNVSCCCLMQGCLCGRCG